MAHKLKILVAAIAGAACMQQASAELYISPVVRNAVQSTAPAQAPTPKAVYQAQPTQQAQQAQRVQRVQRAQPVQPRALTVSPTRNVEPVREATQILAPAAPKPSGLFGRDIPLNAALGMLLPNANSWEIVFEPGLETKKVSWRDVTNWKDAISQISRDYGVIVGLNEKANRISIAKSAEMAQTLARPGHDIWHLQAGKSLRENLVAWGKLSGWNVDWAETKVDYPIDHTAILVGPFAGPGGVVDSALRATSVRDTPLIGTFYGGNKVVVISEAGYKPERPVHSNADQTN